MKICICNDISDGDLKRLVDKGYTDEQILEYHTSIVQCGTCSEFLKEYLKKLRGYI